ncbi:hypothetical protein CSC70_06395 [Pseudoxanthomonas kalamensis DSM 18571]|uniref:NDR1/HIN1-like protein n=1 Tax=Pseudoxanthomonas kalamensis TaxID=289483 RepID=UPI001391E7A2|nr:LEA type 2 family protein [Pseudoxanthomonas kalamensis]KAF1710319.1 hypothetical protein CSC70_06395 [Pseudoxanthomonas kalamensis DSM 18571]
MQRRGLIVSFLLLGLALTACSGGPVRRVSPPAVSIQQLTVNADGSWKLDLRLQNYSSIPMRFDSLDLAVSAGGQDAGRLQGSPAISIGPESADVTSLAFTPTSAGRIAVADALAGRRPLGYALAGTLSATPEDAKSREFEVDARNTLNPAPGLDGVLR